MTDLHQVVRPQAENTFRRIFALQDNEDFWSDGLLGINPVFIRFFFMYLIVPTRFSCLTLDFEWQVPSKLWPFSNIVAGLSNTAVWIVSIHLRICPIYIPLFTSVSSTLTFNLHFFNSSSSSWHSFIFSLSSICGPLRQTGPFWHVLVFFL